MASKTHFMTGWAAWCKADVPDDRYGNYTMDLFLDEAGMQEFKNSGMRSEIKVADSDKLPEDLQGKEFIKVRRDPDKLFEGMDAKPKKLINEDGEYVPFDKKIGNGSYVTVKVSVYDTQRGKGHRWEAVAVETLVPFEGDDSDLPF